jgi:Mrp family chromosome partitioning ATPase
MARLLEAMKHAETALRPPYAAPEPVRAAPPVPPSAADFDEADTAVPFIEVGPSRFVEASPDVLARRPSPLPTLVPTSPDVARAVSFRPLPAPAGVPAAIAPEVIAFHQPGHPVSGQYHELLGAVLATVPGRVAPALLFTGSAAGAGTTDVVVNLAVTAARQGRRVTVIDVHAGRPAVAARLGLCDRPGLSEVLAGLAPLDDALQETEQPGLVALTSGGPAVTPPRGAEVYRSLLRLLRQRSDLILLDAPRWDARPDVSAPGGASDAAFLVLPASADATPSTDELVRQFPALGVRLAGCVAAR